MVKDIIVFYRKKNYFDFNQLETLFSHSEKLILKSSLTLKRHFNSGLWPLPRTVGLVCVLCSGGGDQDIITIQTFTITPLSATVSRKCVGVGGKGWGSGCKCISILQRVLVHACAG